MQKVLLDTDIVSELLKQRNLNLLSRATAYRAIIGYYTTSIITVMEVVKGWQKLGREDKITQFLTRWKREEVLTMGFNEGVLAGRIYADLEKNGQRIGYADSMIAAIAVENNLTLVTGNITHYQRVQVLGYRLRLDNWRRNNPIQEY